MQSFQIPAQYCRQISNQIIGLVADGGNHFTQYGIQEGMLLIIDKDKEFKEGHLSCYSEVNEKGTKTYSLSKTQKKDCIHVGRLVLAIRNYEV